MSSRRPTAYFSSGSRAGATAIRRGSRLIRWAPPSLSPDATLICSAGSFGGDAGLLLDVTGCGHLYGQGEAGERALMADLVQRLGSHDFTCRAAMADTAGTAWALARYGEKQADLFCPHNGQREALAKLPVDGLRLDPAILETFLKLGLRRIDDLYPLPRAPLSRRFGDQPLTRLDQALGKIDEPIEPRRPPPVFRSRISFVEPIGRPEDIASATERLILLSAGSSSRRASALASLSSRSTASMVRSTARRSAPAAPIAIRPSS